MNISNTALTIAKNKLSTVYVEGAGTTTKTTKQSSKKTSKKTSKKPSKPKKERKLKIFCGITQPIPKTHRLGSMKECLELKQVRYYGLKKIDSKLADSINDKKDSKMELISKISGLKGKLTKLKKDIDASKNATDKTKLMGDFDSVRKEILVLNEKFLKIK